jgi:hypothetical protein
MKLNKSPGPDLLHPRVLYEVRNEIVSPLTLIFNQSMNSGVLPEDWKTSFVSVLFKKGKKDCIDNYRPISLTCICCKLMESIIRDKIMSFLLENKVFSGNQYGFIKGRSTVLQLLKVVDNWVKALDDGGQIDVIYTDFEKAFDKVPHRRLISKLYAYGVDTVLIMWIKAFLSSRSQQVRVGVEKSACKPVLSGIPQGSVLGPLLFVLFINDLPTVCDKGSQMFMFADDAKLYKCIKSDIDSNILNKCCNDLYTWSETWLMKLNTSKCKVLSICHNKCNIIKYDYGLDVAGQGFVLLEHEDCMKDLGVWMESELSFEKHITDKINVANKMIGIIKRNFVDLDSKCFLLLYKCMVRSHLEYAVSVWSPYKKGLISSLEDVQRRATKLVKGCKSLSYIDRLHYLQLPSLRYRRIRGDMLEVFKILNNFYDCDVVPQLDRNLDSRTRGHSRKLIVERCKYDLRKYSFCNRVINVWNSLPENVVSSCSVNAFKNNLDRHWKCQVFYYDFEASLPGLV